MGSDDDVTWFSLTTSLNHETTLTAPQELGIIEVDPMLLSLSQGLCLVALKNPSRYKNESIDRIKGNFLSKTQWLPVDPNAANHKKTKKIPVIDPYPLHTSPAKNSVNSVNQTVPSPKRAKLAGSGITAAAKQQEGDAGEG